MKLMTKKEDYVMEGLDRKAIRYLEDEKIRAKSLGKSFVMMKLDEKDDLKDMLSKGEWRLESLVVARGSEPKKYIMLLRANIHSYGTYVLANESHIDRLGMDKEWFKEIVGLKDFIKGLMKKEA